MSVDDVPLVFLDTMAMSVATDSKVPQRAELTPGTITSPDGSPPREITILKHSNHPRSPLLGHPRRITAPRYLEVLDDLGAVQNGSPDANTFVDAFLLWTAEAAGCRYFLTLDRNILSNYRSASLVAVKPSVLLARLDSE